MNDRRVPLDTMDDTDLTAIKEAAARRRPLVADVPKRQRTRLAKAELLILLAVHCDGVAADVEGTSGYTRPFAEWGDDDPLRDLCHRYGLGAADITRLLRGLGAELENSAMRRGYEDTWR